MSNTDGTTYALMDEAVSLALAGHPVTLFMRDRKAMDYASLILRKITEAKGHEAHRIYRNDIFMIKLKDGTELDIKLRHPQYDAQPLGTLLPGDPNARALFDHAVQLNHTQYAEYERWCALYDHE